MMMNLDFYFIYTFSFCGKLPAVFGMQVWNEYCSLYKVATFFIPVGFLSIKPEQINWHVWTVLDFVYILDKKVICSPSWFTLTSALMYCLFVSTKE